MEVNLEDVLIYWIGSLCCSCCFLIWMFPISFDGCLSCRKMFNLFFLCLDLLAICSDSCRFYCSVFCLLMTSIRLQVLHGYLIVRLTSNQRTYISLWVRSLNCCSSSASYRILQNLSLFVFKYGVADGDQRLRISNDLMRFPRASGKNICWLISYVLVSWSLFFARSTEPGHWGKSSAACTLH